MPQAPDTTSRKPERDALGRLLPGQPSLNPHGRPTGSVSIKDKVRQYLDDNPEQLKQMVEMFVKTKPALVWQMLEGRPGQKLQHGGPNDEPLLPTDAVISEVAKKLNAVLGTGGVGGDGDAPGAVGAQA